MPAVLPLATWMIRSFAARVRGGSSILRRFVTSQIHVASLVLSLLVAGCGESTPPSKRPVTLKGNGRQTALHLRQELGARVNVVNSTPSNNAMGYRRGKSIAQHRVESTAPRQTDVSPMLFPIIFLVVLGSTALALFARKLCQEVDEPIDPFAPGERPAVHRFLLVVLVVVGFIYAAPVAGFVLTATAMLLLLLWSFGTNWKANFAVSLTLPAALYHLSASYLNAPLPHGWLGW